MCGSEVLNVEFTEAGPKTRLDFQVDEASGPGSAPYAKAARFETTGGTIYKVVVDANGDIWAENEASAGYSQINIFAGKGEVSAISAGTATVALCTTVTDSASPEKWGYGVGIMAQPGDGFKLTDDTTWEAVASAGDSKVTLAAAWAGSGSDATYHIRRRLSIAATRKVHMSTRQGLLIFTDESSRPLFWDGTTFGEFVCFCNPRDDTVSIADALVSGAMSAGAYWYRAIARGPTGSFCPPCPEQDIGTEYFAKTVTTNKQVVLTKKIYAQGFPSWCTKLDLFRSVKNTSAATQYQCSRGLAGYRRCPYHTVPVTRHYSIWGTTYTFSGKTIGQLKYCSQPTALSCPDKRDLPLTTFFYVDTYDLDGTAIQDNNLDSVIIQNDIWQEYGSRKHVDVYTPANWTELPTYISGLGALVPFKGHLFGWDHSSPDNLRFSGRPVAYSETGGADEPGWWFLQNTRIAGRDDGEVIRSVFTFAGDLYVAKDHSLMRLDTRRPDPAYWVLVPVSDKAGAFAQDSVLVGTRKVLMLCHAEGQPRMFMFNGLDCRDVSDPIRTTLDGLDLSDDTARVAVDSMIWKEHAIFNAKYSTTRKQMALNMSTGAWTVWDAAVKSFFDGLKSNTYLLCLKNVSETKLQRFLAASAAITSRWTSKAYNITEGHVWKMLRGIWLEVESDSGLLISSGGSELSVAVAVDGGAYSSIMPATVGTFLSTATRQQRWLSVPLQKSGDEFKFKIQISAIDADFQVRKLVMDYEPQPGKRTKA